MQSSRVALTALALLSLTLVLGGDSFDDPQSRHRQLEVARLRAHFDSVDAELRQAATRDLSPAQRAARATLIGWLREYREAGSFPLNDRFSDRAMPFFRDSRGVLCAMAYLIDRSGRHDLVNTVAATRNNAFIPELAGDPELRTWLEGAGLSVAEAARIQPFYEPFLRTSRESMRDTRSPRSSSAAPRSRRWGSTRSIPPRPPDGPAS